LIKKVLVLVCCITYNLLEVVKIRLEHEVVNMRLPIQVLVYPVRRAGSSWQYLVLRRISRREGFWQGITGAVKEGETLDEAARRELFEETGFVPLTLKRIDYSYSIPVKDEWKYMYASDIKEITEYVFLAYVGAETEPVLDPGEHDHYKWCTYHEAVTLLRWPENKEALKRCAALLEL